jgi:asparagine N-glycosylation enzyme membrane subunit Stt3
MMEQSARGFLEALFDLSFTSFVTTRLVKVLYILAIVGAAVGCLMMVVGGFARGAVYGVVSLVILAPLFFLAVTIYARVLLEVVMVIFRIGEHAAEIAEQGRKKAGGAA